VDIAEVRDRFNVIAPVEAVRQRRMILVRHAEEEDIIRARHVMDAVKWKILTTRTGERSSTMKEWDYNEVLAAVSKAMGVELENADLEEEDDEEEENEMVCLGVKSSTVYFGGQKLPSNPATKINVNGPIGKINIDFDHNY